MKCQLTNLCFKTLEWVMHNKCKGQVPLFVESFVELLDESMYMKYIILWQ
jgi:hypothetical protein